VNTADQYEAMLKVKGKKCENGVVCNLLVNGNEIAISYTADSLLYSAALWS